MKLAIMQPYFFPYLGYFQLIDAVDTFVLYDDVNFIKGGWINRNYILSKGERSRITLQLKGASPNLLINQIAIGGNRKKLLETIRQSYSKAPHYYTVMPMIDDILNNNERNLATYLDFSLRVICKYLGIYPNWYLSSRLQKDVLLRGQVKIIEICKELGAGYYINMSGGRILYDRESFEVAGLTLSFLEPGTVNYIQFRNKYVPNLSIIDVMMFNSREQCQALLKEYRVVR